MYMYLEKFLLRKVEQSFIISRRRNIMAIRRIITFAVCLAVCIAGIAVGVSNMRADEGSVTEKAGLGAIGASGTAEGINLTQSILETTSDGYKLKGNVIITSTEDAAYTELQVLNRTSGDPVVLDGNDCTITTSVSLFVRLANCTIKNLTVVAAGDFLADPAATSGSVGIISATAYGSVKFENVTVNGSVTINSTYANAVNVAGFIGYNNNQTSTVFENCTNNANISVTHNVAKSARVAGFAAQTTGIGEVKVTNSTNNGTITVIKNTGMGIAAGFLAWAENSAPQFDGCTNFGNITVSSNGSDHHRSSGFVNVGNDANLSHDDDVANGIGYACFTDCANLGNITMDIPETKVGRAAGFVDGKTSDTTTTSSFIRCVNAGDVTNKSTNNTIGWKYRPFTSGFVAFPNKANVSYEDCINIGNISGASGCVGSFQAYAGRVTVADNNYSITVDGAADSTAFVDGTATCYETISAPTATFVTNAKNNKVNNAAALIAVILAEQGKAMTTFDGFTVAAGAESGQFVTEIDMDFYDDVKSIAGSVEFGAIITLAVYDEKIPGDFTHETFNTYLDSVKTPDNKFANIEALYMTASFKNGEGLTKDGDAYKANVTLTGELYPTTYIARTYIKIGTDAYIYSK